jgi:O-antigen/teichoic acid export membrane protein
MTSVRRNVAWALAGNVGYAACQWAVFVAVARLGGAADAGRLALGLAVTAPVIVLANLQLRAVQATDARGEHPFAVYAGLRLVTTAAALGAIAALALGAGYRGATLGVILACGLAKAFETLADVVFGLLQQAEDLRRIALSMLGKGVASVAAVACVLAATGSLVAAIAAMALAWGAWLAVWDLRNARRIAPLRASFDGRRLTRLAWIALPLGGVSALNSLIANVPRYAVERHLGTAALGHFAGLAYLLVAATQPVLAIAAAATPRLARHFAGDRGAYRVLTVRALGASACVGAVTIVVAALAGRPFLALAYGPGWPDEAPILVWLAGAAALGFLSSALGAAITAARAFGPQLVAAALACVVCAAASEALIPRVGLVGAAWALLAGEAIRAACLALVWLAATRARTDVADVVVPWRRRAA